MSVRTFLARIKTVNRYRRWPWLLFYADGKILLDPAYAAVARALAGSHLPLLDLGCGVGLLVAYLRTHGHAAPVLGIDADPKKIDVANRAIAGTNTRFIVDDARNFPAHCGDVIMLDVLHYLDDAAQRKILERMAAAVAPGGLALIRVTLNEAGWRLSATRLEEWLIQRCKWIPWAGSNYPGREEIIAPFRAAGFLEDVRPMWGWTPFNSYLFTFRRAAASTQVVQDRS